MYLQHNYKIRVELMLQWYVSTMYIFRFHVTHDLIPDNLKQV